MSNRFEYTLSRLDPGTSVELELPDGSVVKGDVRSVTGGFVELFGGSTVRIDSIQVVRVMRELRIGGPEE